MADCWAEPTSERPNDDARERRFMAGFCPIASRPVRPVPHGRRRVPAICVRTGGRSVRQPGGNRKRGGQRGHWNGTRRGRGRGLLVGSAFGANAAQGTAYDVQRRSPSMSHGDRRINRPDLELHMLEQQARVLVNAGRNDEAERLPRPALASGTGRSRSTAVVTALLRRMRREPPRVFMRLALHAGILWVRCKHDISPRHG